MGGVKEAGWRVGGCRCAHVALPLGRTTGQPGYREQRLKAGGESDLGKHKGHVCGDAKGPKDGLLAVDASANVEAGGG